MTISTYRPKWPLLALLLAISLVALGCGPADEIQSYSIPKEVAAQHATPAGHAEVAGEPTDRMLAAILPVGDRAWFFKVVGPITTIDKRAEEIQNFFAGVRLGEDGRAKWELPTGWDEQGPGEMRAATILVPADDKPLEITVTPLGWTGTPDDVLSNVNRWRGQLQLPQVGPGQLGDSTREIKIGDATMTLVDLRGRFAGGPAMRAPFAGGAGGASGAAPSPGANLPAGHPPLDAGGNMQRGESPSSSSADVPKFEAPKSWNQLPPGEFRKAAFEVGEGEQKARITVIDFRVDSGPMIADPLQNINQWRGAIGLGPLEKDGLESAVESIEVDGQPAIYAKMIPDPAKPEESKLDQATLAAMVTSGERIWFFKMLGDRDLVAAQEGEFKKFLKSVRFADDAGAPDGDK